MTQTLITSSRQRLSYILAKLPVHSDGDAMRITTYSGACMCCQSSSRSTLRHLPLMLAAALSLGTSGPTCAGNVGGGATRDLNLSDPVESWTVAQGSTLNINAGALADRTTASQQSFINVLGGSIVHNGTASALTLSDQSRATVQRGTLVSAAGFGVALTTTGGETVGTSADFFDSTISGSRRAVTMASGASLTLSNTRATATGGNTREGALTTFGGAISVRNGSVVEGGSHGIRASMSNSDASGAATERPGDGVVLIDGSTVIGRSGSAIAVSSDASSSLAVTDILVRGGSRLIGGDGNLLSVEQGTATNRVTTANLVVEQSLLEGNVSVADDGRIGTISLANGGRINGAFERVSRVSVGKGGYWQLSSDSAVELLNLQSGGTAELGTGTAFNTLTVADDFNSPATIQGQTRLSLVATVMARRRCE